MAEAAKNDAAAEPGEATCGHCGYNLATIPSDRDCPECGTPVAWSLGNASLEYSNPAWLRRIVLGTDWLIGAAVLSLLIGFPLRIYGLTREVVATSEPLRYALGTFELLEYIFLAVAVWLITSDEPKPLRFAVKHARIEWLRPGSLVMVGLHVGSMFFFGQQVDRMASEGFASWLWLMIGIIALIRLSSLQSRIESGSGRFDRWIMRALLLAITYLVCLPVLMFVSIGLDFIIGVPTAVVDWFKAFVFGPLMISYVFAIPIVIVLAIVAMVRTRVQMARILAAREVESPHCRLKRAAHAVSGSAAQ